jgi:hypothetical protein
MSDKSADSDESTTSIRWEKDVAPHDYEAAEAYLSLRFDEDRAEKLVKRLRAAEITQRRANDVLRACGREPLELDDPGVRRDLITIARGQKLSPVLVVYEKDGGPDIADGYHRVSLAYRLDPFAMIPLRIAASDIRKEK